jgi:hypothetical protein
MGRPLCDPRGHPRHTDPAGAVHSYLGGLQVRRPDGRVVERVHLPVLLIEDVAREAERRGQSFEDVAGDLVAEALPEALREAAEALLAEGRASLTRNIPGLESQPVLPASTNGDVSYSPVPSIEIVPARRLNQGTSSDAGTS